MASMYPIDASEVSVFAATGKSSSSFAGMSWSEGQPVPVPQFAGVLPPGGASPAPANEVINGVAYEYTAGTGPSLTVIASVVGSPTLTANPNANAPPKAHPPKALPPTPVAVVPITVGAAAFVLAIVALVLVLTIGAR